MANIKLGGMIALFLLGVLIGHFLFQKEVVRTVNEEREICRKAGGELQVSQTDNGAFVESRCVQPEKVLYENRKPNTSGIYFSN